MRTTVWITLLLFFVACKPSKQDQLKNYTDLSFSDALDSARVYFGLGDTTLHPNLKLSSYDSLQLKEAFLKSMTGKNSLSDAESKLRYGSYDPFTVTITHLLNQKAGFSWGSYSHTGIPVPVFSKGVGQERFEGFYRNNEVAQKIRDIAGFKSPSRKNGSPKYVFLFIGDGMALPQIEAAEAFLSHKNQNSDFKPTGPQLNITQMPVLGMASTQAENRYITGSAAAGTALATGHKTSIGTISKSPDHTKNYETLAEMARQKGLKVGIISNVSIDHATPACFYAHENARDNYNNIALQMAGSNFDFFGGGFARGEFEKYKKKDPEGDAKDVVEVMQKAGYHIAKNKSELALMKKNDKCWAYTTYDADAAMAYDIDRQNTEISLAEFTSEGIRLLENPNGFFMMVEGGKIDWACHANDVTSAIHDVIAFDKALNVALEFQKSHPKETLIVVTADHECGALALGYAATKYDTAFEILAYQKMSFEAFTKKVHSWQKQKNIAGSGY